MIIPDKMNSQITLHGLGFVQVQLQGNQRLHVWHPELPRRTCFEHSAIHDHRFSFRSTVLIGAQRNISYEVVGADDGEYIGYVHEGKRTPKGGRPWVADMRVDVAVESDHTIDAGESYLVSAYGFHRTEPCGNGKVATLMQKLWEGDQGAHSLCRAGVRPDADFDRFQWSDQQLWEVVQEVLQGGAA